MTMIRAPQRGAGALPWLKQPQRPMGAVPWFDQRLQSTHGAAIPGSRIDRNPAENTEDQKVMHRRKKRRGH